MYFCGVVTLCMIYIFVLHGILSNKRGGGQSFGKSINGGGGSNNYRGSISFQKLHKYKKIRRSPVYLILECRSLLVERYIFILN